MKQITFFAVLIISNILFAQNQSENILINQIGFYPHAPKKAVIVGEISDDKFYLLTSDLKDTVFKGTLNPVIKSQFSNKETHIADFTVFNKTGIFVLSVSKKVNSYPFSIKPEVHKNLMKASIKGYYYQRASIVLDEKYAGKWARNEGHPDNKVLIHSSAVSDRRTTQTLISSSRGWYDAGDYNKYIVNSGITMGTLFSLYEDQPEYFKSIDLNIPESKNQIPDLLDEVLWNLRWMLTMQDPNDGGVYHKLTNTNFDKMIMPDKAVADRFVVQKSTAATLDFAATMAQASRIFKSFEKHVPGLSDSCLIAARKAWMWAEKTPDLIYDQNEMNKKFDPDIVTGEYGDKYVADEFIWAASELYITTKEEKYYSKIKINENDKLEIPSWADVKTLGYYSLLRFEKQISTSSSGKKDIEILKKLLLNYADGLIANVLQNSNQTVMTKNAKNFIWGSNSVAANQSILLLQAYRISKNKKYLDFALANLDYILGRNSTGYSFVTGYGSKSPQHPHHRPSEGDVITDPIPGLLVAGPNPGQQDKCNYPTNIADESYSDNVCSYASNEIAINWNAPLVYILGELEALFNTKIKK